MKKFTAEIKLAEEKLQESKDPNIGFPIKFVDKFPFGFTVIFNEEGVVTLSTLNKLQEILPSFFISVNSNPTQWGTSFISIDLIPNV